MLLGIDIGGTFTDLVYFDGKSFSVVKVSTTPKKPAEGVLNAIDTAGLRLKDVSILIHATTLGTNMFLGQEGLIPPKLALITTKGFRDVIEIGRQRRPELYNLFFEKPKSLVRRRDRFEIEERINAKGEIITPLNENELHELAKTLQKYDVIVISFLHSYKNPIHEIKAKEILKKLCPNAEIITSHEIDPEYKEFERTSTTVLNAFLKPMMSKYLKSLLDSLQKRGFKGRFFVMQSSGGIATVDVAMNKPVAFVESGPAAGAIAVAYYSKIIGEKNVIGFDMGGTTAKACTIVNHEPSITTEYEIGGNVHVGRIIKGSGYPVRFPFIDLAEVSAGGGTIAWIDEGGALRVGPMSAGADPGPACYGRGNDRATITDAHLVLGRLGEKLSTLKLNKDLAKTAIVKLADQLGMSIEETATGILKIANTIMAKALRIVTVERGHDPRNFVMFVFGGAGGLHGVELAEELKVKSVLVPQHAGVFSAFGLLLSDYRVDKVKSLLVSVENIGDENVEKEFESLVRSAVKEIRLENAEIKIIRQVDLRYKGQAYELTVPWHGEVGKAVEDFHKKHEALFGFSSPDEEVEIVNLRVTAIGIMPKPKITAKTVKEHKPKPERYRDVFFEEDWIRTPIYARNKLKAGARIEGPAIIEDYDTTIVIPPDHVAIVDGYLNVVIES